MAIWTKDEINVVKIEYAQKGPFGVLPLLPNKTQLQIRGKASQLKIKFESVPLIRPFGSS